MNAALTASIHEFAGDLHQAWRRCGGASRWQCVAVACMDGVGRALIRWGTAWNGRVRQGRASHGQA